MDFKDFNVIDEALSNLTDLEARPDVLNSMTDNELENLLDDLQTLNNQLEKAVLGGKPLVDIKQLEAVLNNDAIKHI